MTELLTSAQMRAIETAAISAGRVTGLALMERAGQGVVDAIQTTWPGLCGRAVVFCGPGNNGGDGYVIARLLQAQGWQVAIFALAPPATPGAIAMAAAWEGPSRPLADLAAADLQGAALCIDALFGTGLQRPIGPEVWQPLTLARGAGARIVAVDILSGLCADSGQVRSLGGYLDGPADLTVSFEWAKLGHVLAEGGQRRGAFRVVPIGLSEEPHPDGVVRLVTAPGAELDKAQGHKFSHGHLLVLSGGLGKGGAARLAARAGLRIGAGLVTLGCPPAAMAENATRMDAVMLTPLAHAGDMVSLLVDARLTALCLGPGFGLGAGQAAKLAAALRARKPAVLDADALTLLSRDPEVRALLHDQLVLTPHCGEFARLVPDLSAQMANPPDRGPAFSKVDAVRAAAARLGTVVLLKGPDTVIATPKGQVQVHAALGDRAAPWLATAGSGDVLAGIIAGLLARGFAPERAAAMGVWLHVAAARQFGPGMIAEDLPEALPSVLRALFHAETGAGVSASSNPPA